MSSDAPAVLCTYENPTATNATLPGRRVPGWCRCHLPTCLTPGPQGYRRPADPYHSGHETAVGSGAAVVRAIRRDGARVCHRARNDAVRCGRCFGRDERLPAANRGGRTTLRGRRPVGGARRSPFGHAGGPVVAGGVLHPRFAVGPRRVCAGHRRSCLSPERHRADCPRRSMPACCCTTHWLHGSTLTCLVSAGLEREAWRERLDAALAPE